MTPEPKQPTPDEVCRMVAEFVLAWRPYAVGCRIEIDLPEGDGGMVQDTIAVPLIPTDEDLRSRVLAVLGKLRPGEWMGGKALAAEVEADSGSGHFKRTMLALKADDKVDSNKNLGFRLKVAKS